MDASSMYTESQPAMPGRSHGLSGLIRQANFNIGQHIDTLVQLEEDHKLLQSYGSPVSNMQEFK